MSQGDGLSGVMSGRRPLSRVSLRSLADEQFARAVAHQLRPIVN